MSNEQASHSSVVSSETESPAGAHAYADGAEDAVLAALVGAVDRSAGSDELASHIVDWPTEYHFSQQRTHLLRPLRLKPGQRVLDCGAGSGVFARYLGERGADVVALEPAPRRAEAAALRCADLPNVTVRAEGLDTFHDPSGFDCILSIGVFEYAASTPARAEAFLTRVTELLRPGGVVVLAIENQLGLKYLLGASEDHASQPWVGLEGYQGQPHARTFPRRLLSSLLARHGLASQHWLYPYPDYKLPTTILSDTVFADPSAGERVDQLVRWSAAGHSDRPLHADPRLVLRSFVSAGLGHEVANSFLVVAARTPQAVRARIRPRVLAWLFTGDRRRRWEKHQMVVERPRRQLVAVGRWPSPEEPADGWLQQHREHRRTFLEGPTTEQLALDACARGEAALGAVLHDWRTHLAGLERPVDPRVSQPSPFRRPQTRALLPPNYLDVTLSNFVRTADGSLHFVDTEWHVAGGVDADLACLRALWWFAVDLVLHRVAHPWGPHAPTSEVTRALCRVADLPVADSLLGHLLYAEANLQHKVGRQSEGDMVRQLTALLSTSQHSGTGAESAPRPHVDTPSPGTDERVDQAVSDLHGVVLESGAARGDLLTRDEAAAAAAPDRAEARADSLDRHVAELDRTIADLRTDRDHWASQAARHALAAGLRSTDSAPRPDVPAGPSSLIQRIGVLTSHPLGRRFLRRLARYPLSIRTVRAAIAETAASGLVDPSCYLAQFTEPVPRDVAVWHYQAVGQFLNLRPHPLFDPAFYLAQQHGARSWLENPLLHYVRTGNGQPHPLFDADFYAAAYPDVVAAGINPLRHYAAHGGPEGRRPSPLFDGAFYLAQNPDVASAGINPLAHFLDCGAREGRDPSPQFSTLYYARTNPDVVAAGVNPLVHYALYGWKEGREPSPSFSGTQYLQRHADVQASGLNPIAHYVLYGAHEGRQTFAIGASAYAAPVTATIETPTAPVRIARRQSLIVRGFLDPSSPPVSALALVADGRVIPVTHGVPRPDRAIPLGPAGAHGFEAAISFEDSGRRVITLEATVAGGPTCAVCTLPVIEVTDEIFEASREHRVPTTRRFSVLYVDGVGRHFASVRYRIDHVREALGLAGVATDATTVPELFDRLDRLKDADVLVIFRSAWDWRLDAIVTAARRWRIPVVFDVDDYVFEPRYATHEWIAGIRDWSAAQVAQYEDGVRRYRQFLEQADYFTGSTTFLVDRARELGKAAFLITNSMSQELIDLSLRVRHTARADGVCEIVYLSGTATHQRDFGVAAGAVARVMIERPSVRLRVIGYLDVDEYPELEPVRSRIATEPFVPWQQLPSRTATASIAIAPLEIGNPFCEAKSELKYFEATVSGLAVVASATGVFGRAIVDGETGFLCRTADEWHDRLLRLVDDGALRTRMAENGAAHALNRYSPDYVAHQAFDVYQSILADYRSRLAVPADALEIAWVAPAPTAGSGGHNDIFLAANLMVERGHHVTVHFTDTGTQTRDDLYQFISDRFGYRPRFDIECGVGSLGSVDALIATHNATVPIVRRHAERAAISAYFVQDFEPYFSPISTEHFRAEQTYRSGLLCITLGPWLEDLLRSQYAARARHIPFWVERRHYFTTPIAAAIEKGQRGPRRLLYFARPHMARRCYDLGLDALRLLATRRSDVEICLFGASSFPGDLSFPHTALGLLQPPELGALYRSGTVGLAFSTTNPSLVTFEMMACGLPLVDLDVLDARKRHGGYPALLAEPSPEAITDAIDSILDDETLRRELAMRSSAFTAGLPSAGDALRRIAAILEEELGH